MDTEAETEVGFIARRGERLGEAWAVVPRPAETCSSGRSWVCGRPWQAVLPLLFIPGGGEGQGALGGGWLVAKSADPRQA